MTYTVGLVGARGYVGQEFLQLLSDDPVFDVALATSRSLAGKSFADAFPGCGLQGNIEDLTPHEAAEAACDIYVLGLPNGNAAPYVSAIDELSPESLVVDLSTDHRNNPGWVYGLPELKRGDICGARRIANPGCYATAAILALNPVKKIIRGVPSVFGVSGYSGAGTTPGPRNDPERLRGNIVPYGFFNHAHEHEISSAIGSPVRFTPHVAQFFRGLLCTVHVPLNESFERQNIHEMYRLAYDESDAVTVQESPPELRDIINTPGAIVGGMSIDNNTGVLTVACVLDNLLKGAASQALQNIQVSHNI